MRHLPHPEEMGLRHCNEVETLLHVVGNNQSMEESMAINMKCIMLLVERMDDNTIQITGGLKPGWLGKCNGVVPKACETKYIQEINTDIRDSEWSVNLVSMERSANT